MAATNFKTENNTYRKLIGNGLTYRIPRFQRDYSWTDDEWEDLWLDLIGTLQPGMPADIVVYDLERLAVTPSEPVYEDIIGGGKRLVQRADGYRAIIVNGVQTFADGVCTGALPGRVLRTSAYEPRA